MVCAPNTKPRSYDFIEGITATGAGRPVLMITAGAAGSGKGLLPVAESG